MSETTEYWIEEINQRSRTTFSWNIGVDDDGAMHIWQSKDGEDKGLHILGGGMSLSEALSEAFGWF